MWHRQSGQSYLLKFARSHHLYDTACIGVTLAFFCEFAAFKLRRNLRGYWKEARYICTRCRWIIATKSTENDFTFDQSLVKSQGKKSEGRWWRRRRIASRINTLLVSIAMLHERPQNECQINHVYQFCKFGEDRFSTIWDIWWDMLFLLYLTKNFYDPAIHLWTPVRLMTVVW